MTRCAARPCGVRPRWRVPLTYDDQPEPGDTVAETMCNGTVRYWLVVHVTEGRSYATMWSRVLAADEVAVAVTRATIEGTAWQFDRRDHAQ